MTRKTLLGIVLAILSMSIYAANPKREFRATWVTTHYSIDWPKTKATSTANIETQKKQLTDILDKLVASNLNAFTFQVRPVADAFYQSSYEPWADQLTGTRGQDPGYDPLAFAVEEAHKRGLELHAWVNPFRYEVTANKWGKNDPIRKNHPDWILTYNNGSYAGTILDPGLPEVRDYTVEVIREIVKNYDIDGIIFDDYFYPYGGTTTEDAASKAIYKTNPYQTDTEWRCENIDKAMKAVYDMIQEEKPWVRYGIAPFGTWTTKSSWADKYGISLPAGITSMDALTTLACNTISWMDGGYVDYIAPQIYWPTTSSGQDYDVISKWWNDMAKHFSDQLPGKQKIHFFSANNDYSDWVTPSEMGLEVDANRRTDQMGGTGAIFYNTNQFFSRNIHTYLASNQFSTRAIMPAMDWKKTTALDSVTSLELLSKTLIWKHDKAERFTVYAFPKGKSIEKALNNPKYLLGVVWDDMYNVSHIDDLANTTFAVCAYDRYGNEYAAAFYNKGEETDFDDEDEDDNTIPAPDPEPEAVAGRVTIEQVWSKSISDVAYLSGNENRSIGYYNDKLYIPQTSTQTFVELDPTNGTLEATHSLGVSTQYEAFNLHTTRDGQLLAGNSNLNNTVTVYAVDKANGGAVAHPTTLNIGRSDYFSTYGNWRGSGYLLSLSNTGNVAYAPFENGILQTGKTISHSDLPSGGISAKALPLDKTSFLVNTSKHIPTQHALATGALLESFGTDKPAEVGVSGMATFMLSTNRYLIVPADDFGGFDIFDITSGLATAKRVITPTAALGSTANSAYTVGFAVQKKDDEAFIYVLAPNNGIAAYKVTFTPGETGLEDCVVRDIEVQKVIENGQLIIIRDGVRYNVLGIKL